MLRILNFWGDELAAAHIWARRKLLPLKRFRLGSQSQQFTLYSTEDSPPRQILTIGTAQVGDLPEEILQETRGAAIEIVVPSAAILRRSLDPLPAESRPYLENVIRHQLEALFPWDGAETLHTSDVKPRSDGQLDVSIWATSRSPIEPALALAAACQAGDVRIVADHADNDNAPPGIPAIVGSVAGSEARRARFVASRAAAGLVSLAILLIGSTMFVEWSIGSDIDAVDQVIKDRRAVLARKLNANNVGSDRGPEAKRRQTPLAVVVLEDLSKTLPDDTYLTDLSLEADHLRITGVSGNAAGLVPLLELTGRFKNALFYAPATRLSGTSTDRFSIEAVVVAQPQAGK
jgi:general secretion pathway protein L